MKKISKIIVAVLSIVIAFSVVACSNSGDNASSSSSSSKINRLDTSSSSKNQQTSSSENVSSSVPSSLIEPSSSSVPSSSSEQTSQSSSNNEVSSSTGESTSVGGDVSIVDAGLNYTETTEDVLNPGRGFYYYVPVYVVTDTNTEGISVNEYNNAQATWDGGWKDNKQSIAHVIFSLENFSSNMGGTSKDLTTNALNQIKSSLDNLRESKMSAIIRFTYDPDGTSYTGNFDCEPSLNQVLKHVEQVANVVKDYGDCIYSIDAGFFGPWGEQHSTSLGSDQNVSAYYQLVEKWLNSTPANFDICVRRPLYFLHWYNTKYGTNYNINQITQATDRDQSYRIGCYNDGYLSNESDCGTYINRTAEVNWLSTRKTTYGGEVIVDYDTNLPSSYGLGAYMCTEAFITHTTHLNYFYHENVIRSNTKGTAWQQQAYGTGMSANNIDPVYQGKTYYEYIAAHLGYRLVLREAKISSSATAGSVLRLQGKIENVGFSHVTGDKKVYVVLENGSNVQYFEVDFDMDALSSRSTYNYSFSVIVPSNFSGQVKAYLKIASAYDLTKEENKRQIRFANNGSNFNETLGANLIGEVIVN